MAGGIPRNIQQSETMLLGNGEASSSYVKQGNFFWTTCTWENYLPLTCMTCMILSMSKVWNISILKNYIHIINHPGGFHVSFIKTETTKPWCKPPLSIHGHPSWATAVASDIWAPQTTLHLLMRFKCIELCYQVSTSDDGPGNPRWSHLRQSWAEDVGKVFLDSRERHVLLNTPHASKHVKTLHLNRVRHFAKSPST